MSRVATVVVRYGEEVTGGAERLARDVSLRLAARGHELTVLTTCADDYVTWANVLPAGESADGPLRVLRFPVRAQRVLNRWEASMQPLLRGCWTPADELAMLTEQGPDCPALLDHLREHGAGYDAVLFFVVLYAPAVLGIPLVWDRAILVPTLHDELAAHLDATARAVRLARRVIWLTPEEQALGARLYDVQDLRDTVAGVGIEAPVDPPVATVRDRFGLDRPYLLYAGRIDPDKGCGELFDAFLPWAARDGRADLVLAGRAWMEVPRHPAIRHLGFVETADLWGLMAGATATVIPSRAESLSLLALESLAVATPIVVPTGSPVLEGHVRRSGAGLVYRDGAELGGTLTRLLDDGALRDAMGSAGRRYVAAGYTWDRVISIYEDAVAAVSRRTSRRRTG